MNGDLTERQKRCIPNVKFELIPIRNLVSNQDYQRPLSESHIMNTLEEFDVFQINPVKVSRRDGVNYVFDGQHTIEIVAAESGSRDTPVWCMVYELNYEEEAHIFAEQQKHVKALVPYEMFKAHIEAGDEKEMMIQSIVESYGLKITGSARAGGICAINTLEKIYDKYGQSVLNATLRLVVETWEGEAQSFSANVMRAISRMIITYGDALKEDVFKDHVGGTTVKAIGRMAKERGGGSLGYAEVMVNLYNTKNKHHLPQQKLYGKVETETAGETEESTDEGRDGEHMN